MEWFNDKYDEKPGNGFPTPVDLWQISAPWKGHLKGQGQIHIRC